MKKNKWLLITVYSILAVIIVGVIVCCFVKVSYSPNLNEPNVISASYTNSTKPGAGTCTKDQTPEKFNDIMKEYYNSYYETVISAVFSGRAGIKSTVKQWENSNAPDKEFDSYKLIFKFNEEQTIKVNGKVYYPSTNSQMELKYNQCFMEIDETEGLCEHRIYYVVGSTYYYQTVIADFSGLFNLLEKY